MTDGILYAIFYNDVHDPSKLEAVYDLRSRSFLDGRARDVPPVRWRGLIISAPHHVLAEEDDFFRRTTADWDWWQQCGGHVEARDAASGRLAWRILAYKTDPDRRSAEEDVYITSMSVDGDRVLIENERGYRFAVDAASGAVTKLGRTPGRSRRKRGRAPR